MKKITWKIISSEPVIKPAMLHPGLDDNRIAACHVLDLGDRFRMYYWGSGKKGNVILMAESPADKPNLWCGIGDCLLEPQRDGVLNCRGPSFPFVIKIDDKLWYMYFCAWGASRDDGKIPNTTHLAISRDAGITWEYYPHNPVIPLDSQWDKEATGSVLVIKRNNEFWMYYTAIIEYVRKPDGVKTGHGNIIPHICICLAKSQDGISWKKYHRPVLMPRQFNAEPYEYINSKPFVIPDEDGFRMWFNSFGYAYRIQEAVSIDGINWQYVTKNADSYLGVGQEEERKYLSYVVYRKWIWTNWYWLCSRICFINKSYLLFHLPPVASLKILNENFFSFNSNCFL